MKFISKSNRLTVILQPGISEDRLTGRPSRPQVSVRFEGGLAEVKEQALIDMMLSHPAMGRDYVCGDEIAVDPYKNNRKEAEPAHIITEMKYGTPEKSLVSPVERKMSPEMEKIIEAAVNEKMAAFVDLLAKKSAERAAAKVETNEAPIEDMKKKKPGRPFSKKKVEEEVAEPADEDMADETASIEDNLSQ